MLDTGNTTVNKIVSLAPQVGDEKVNRNDQGNLDITLYLFMINIGYYQIYRKGAVTIIGQALNVI